jgi:class 3 adenylate cyclase
MSKEVQLRWIADAEADSMRRAALMEPSKLASLDGAASSTLCAEWLAGVRQMAREVGRKVLGQGSPVAALRSPSSAVDDAVETSATVDPDRLVVTMLFSDIVESTIWAARLGDYSWRELLDRHDAATRREFRRFGGREIRNCGDGFLAIFNSATRAVRCAAAIAEAVGPLGMCVRTGIHTGEVHIRGNEICGIAAHTAARIAEMAGPCELMVSSTVRDLAAGSSLAFEEHGMHRLRGVPEEIRLYSMPLAGSIGHPVVIAADGGAWMDQQRLEWGNS